MDIRTRVESLSARMFDTPQYPSQGSVLFVDLERRKSFSKYLPKDVFRTFLSNRGGNMYLLYNLLLEGREALDPQIPLIFGAGVLQEMTPTTPTARGNLASVSPDHHAILDSNCVDAFPAFLKMQGYDHLVLYGQASAWTLLELSSEAVRFHDAAPYLGMDNTDFTHVIEKDFSCSERKDMAMARITRAGENQVLCSAIMGGRNAMYARGGTGAKMGGLKLKAVMVLGGKTPPAPPPASHHHHPRTPWAELLDAEHLTGYRAGLEGCQQCPIRCNNLDPAELRKPLDRHYGPEDAPLEGLGPLVGIRDPKLVAHLNKLLNNLGLDPASTGGAIAWAMDLYERGIITKAETGALELLRGNSELVEKLLLLTARREGFGDVIADSTQAVERGKYPEQALPYRMALDGLFQSDPHGESILEGFALGFAEAAKERQKPAAVQDALGLCRFATRRAAASGAGLDDFVHQMQIQTQEVFTEKQLEEVGLNISGMERLINSRLGLVAKNESLLDAWIDEEIPEGPFAGERLEKAKFQALKGNVETFLGVNGSGLPSVERHRSLAAVTTAFAVKVTLPDGFPGVSEGAIILDQPLATVAELRAALKKRLPLGAKLLSDNSLIMAVGGTLVMSNEKAYPIQDGDEIAVLRVAPGV
ncbi:MAG: MoaD/ThiS family protein [Acidobacteriota bacterium]|nr:MoaD/ThiS family protein [Acidobacteriota bacterium]